jgi:hypothetical protein
LCCKISNEAACAAKSVDRGQEFFISCSTFLQRPSEVVGKKLKCQIFSHLFLLHKMVLENLWGGGVKKKKIFPKIIFSLKFKAKENEWKDFQNLVH